MRRWLPIVLLTLALLPAAAFSHTPATATQAKAIRAAAVSAHQLTARQAACQVVTISTINRDYASLTWPAKLSASCLRVAANGVVLMHQTSQAWKFVTVGSSFKCPIKGIPTKVGYDLHVCFKS
jgi:hypothetical protein